MDVIPRLADCVTIMKNAALVILNLPAGRQATRSEVKNLRIFIDYKREILRLTPQNDIMM
jgi:hypothetical protein